MVEDRPLTLPQLLDAAADRYPDKPAIVFKQTRIYAELRRRAAAFARGLLALGGGFNTYPAEIENFYLRHPKILDISIVGVPDPVLGEVVMAFVVPKAGETLTPTDIIAFGRDNIANFKVPRHVEIVSEFPLTAPARFRSSSSASGRSRNTGLLLPANDAPR